MIPPSLYFQTPNPAIDFANSPFFVTTALTPWPAGASPRRSGVSSFGIGGTNAHVVLEEAPPVAPTGASRPWQLLVLSAKTPTALAAATENLTAHLRQHSDLPLADVAYTLQVGRCAFPHRRMLVCCDVRDALTALDEQGSGGQPSRVLSHVAALPDRPVVFLFPGQGTQYVQMARDLYEAEPTFRRHVDRCADLLEPHLGRDLRAVLYPDASPSGGSNAAGASQLLQQTCITQPALFTIEYALAQVWMEWGVQPEALIGHSLGEYVAACLAGVFTLEDALALVAARGRLIQQLPAGAMLSVPLPPERIALEPSLALAAVNGPSLCTVSGPTGAIDELHHRLSAQGVDSRYLPTSHAFHSAMMEPILASFTALVSRVRLHAPGIPYISDLTGAWITAVEATNPAYWAQQLRHTVRFAAGMQLLLQEPARILLEVGPGRTLATLARQQADPARDRIVLTSLRHPREPHDDSAFLLGALGQLWLAGAPVAWAGLHRHERRRRLPLPTYPFERQRYWVDAPGRAGGVIIREQEAGIVPDVDREPVHAASDDEVSPGLYARPALLTPYVAPRTEIEQSIAAIWQEVLGVAPIGVHDQFFELGGHSLMATQLIARLREAFPVELPLSRLFEAPTIAGLAEIIEELLLAAIEALPEEEAASLLADE
jgi:phthiocerol/phenolphthiocerol synthesis type-I polyketide synthase E